VGIFGSGLIDRCSGAFAIVPNYAAKPDTAVKS